MYLPGIVMTATLVATLALLGAGGALLVWLDERCGSHFRTGH
jgi:hypothetical protein